MLNGFISLLLQKKSWNEIAENAFDFAESVASTFTSTSPSSIHGNGSLSFITDHFRKLHTILHICKIENMLHVYKLKDITTLSLSKAYCSSTKLKTIFYAYIPESILQICHLKAYCLSSI